MGKAFTTEQDAWLQKNHHPEKFICLLTEEYNAFWGENRNVGTMKAHCKKIGLLQSYGKPFTAEQDAWLLKNSKSMSYKETTEKFNEIYSASRSPNVIKAHCCKIGARFKVDRSWMSNPIGTETIRAGYVWVKVSDTPHKVLGKTSGYENWRQKSHIVWEQHYGSLPPDGYTIVFLDRNTQNCDIKNLYAVNNKVLREMSKKSWWSTDPELTLTAIKWCELHYTLKEVGKRD